MSLCHATVRVVGEWTETVAAGFTRDLKVVIGGSFGTATDLRELKEGDTALVDVRSKPVEDVERSRRPSSR